VSDEKRIKDIKVGQKHTFCKTITEGDVYLYAGLTADFNRIHVDAEYARSTTYGQRVAHGLLTASLVQPCLSALTTPGGVSLNYNFNMKAPVFFGDTITAMAEVIAIRKDKPLVTLKVECTKQDGIVCIDGTALIYILSERENV